jgi:hypothetical protein
MPIGANMKPIIILALFIIFCSPCFAQESLQELQQALLRSNFNETPYSAWVKVTNVKKKNNELFYPTYLCICDVLETFKGKQTKRIEFLRGVENGYQELPIGNEYIVSLFINEENGQYYLGDNGYDLPASNDLIKLARKLEEKLNPTEARP